MDSKVYEYESLIYDAGEPYDGSIVNMGVRNADGSVCYIIGVRKDIRLKEYKTSKGTIQLPYSRPVPVELISDIARWCYETGNHP